MIASLHTPAFSQAIPMDYVGQSELRSVSLSPDGNHVVTLRQNGVGPWYEIEDIIDVKSTIDNSDAKQPTFEQTRVTSVIWPFHDAILAYGIEYDGNIRTMSRMFQRRDTQLPLQIRDVIFVIDPQSGEKRNVFSGPYTKDNFSLNDVSILATSQEKREIALMVTEGYEVWKKKKKKRKSDEDDNFYEKTKTVKNIRLVIVNIDTLESRNAALGTADTIGWTFDEDLNPVLRIDQGEKSYERYYYRSVDKKWELVSSINFLKDEFSIASNITYQASIPVIARPENAKRYGLYTFDPIEGQMSKSIYEHSLYDVSGVFINQFTHEPLYASWWKDTLKLHWFDATARQGASGLDAKLAGQNWRIIETNTDASIWLIYVSAADFPGGYYVWNTKTKTLKLVSLQRPETNKDIITSSKQVRYTAGDGLPLTGYLTSRSTTPKALIVMPHGGPVIRDVDDWDGWAQFFASQNYAVFQPNFRGSGGYGRAFEEKGFEQWGRLMRTDIEDGVDHLIATGQIKSDTPMAMVGASYGGYAALIGGIVTPDRYECIASINGVTDVFAFLDSFDESSEVDQYLKRIWIDRIGDPETDKTKLMEISPLQNIGKMTADLLLIHGEQDEIVPVEQSRSLRDAAKAQGVKTSYIEMDYLGHNGWSAAQQTDALIKVDWFLLRCLP